MTKYLLRRILHGLVSIFIVVAIVMVMIYSMIDRNQVFAKDPVYTKVANNQKTLYKYRKWQEFGYIDYINYSDYMQKLYQSGEIDEDTRREAVALGRTTDKDSDVTSKYIRQFEAYCEENGYTFERKDAIMANKKKVASGGNAVAFGYKDRPLTLRLWTYVRNLITIDNIHAVKDDVGERGIQFTLHDPLAGGKFSPAIIGNGTLHKYLLYCDDYFPFIHQNLVFLNLGKSYTVNPGVEITTTMSKSQGSYVMSPITYPTGLKDVSADDLHSAIYQSPSDQENATLKARFTDNYTSVLTTKANPSRTGYSFTIGVIAVFFAYLLGVPLGILMALKKDKLADRIGTAYIVFIMAVPSLSYILIFKAIGNAMGLPTTFDMQSTSKAMFILPIVSLALPSIGSLMRWLRRYMIDQMNSDYVKFARSGGLSEGEIFSKHILKNAAIPIIHGIPGAVLGALVGAFITERVYVVPGIGGLLINAINAYDNGVIVGVTLFYAVISVASMILGDLLISLVDPRISFTSKTR